jgi:hypothetical protein
LLRHAEALADAFQVVHLELVAMLLCYLNSDAVCQHK